MRLILASLAAAAIAGGAAFAQTAPAADPPPPAKPSCLVSDVPADAKPAPTSIPLDTRKSIFAELQQVIARAQREASAAYPTAEGSSGKRDVMTRALERTYLADALKKRSLTCAAAREIAREGRAAKWPATSPRA
jgi:hypothetical protein